MVRYGLTPGIVDAFEGLLEGLAAEPDPPTTVRKPPEALRLHVADSLSGLEVPALREAGQIADIGAGAGFPGLVLAGALPGAGVDLIEANGRKCAVIERLAAAAGLSNARALAVRAEEWAAGEGRGSYDAVTARAVASLAVVVEYAAPLLRLGGAVVVWRGARDAQGEASGAAAAAALGLTAGEVRRAVPFEGARDRHLHVYFKVEPTPERFPRRPGAARKRPLA